MKEYNGNRAFWQAGTNGIGVLLLHGFTGSPVEMCLLGESLANEGYTVYAPLLPGHGTSPEDLAERTQDEFLEAVEEAYLKLQETCLVIHVVGQSMGGLLALSLATQGKGRKIVALAAPVWLVQRIGEWAGILHHFKAYTERRKKRFRIGKKEITNGYSRMPLKSLAEVLKLRDQVLEELGKITQPLLLIYSNSEHTVKPESADKIAELATSASVEIIRLEKSGHIITLDNEREPVFEHIIRFLKED